MHHLVDATYRDKQVRHLLFIPSPGVSILPATSCNVPPGTVYNHTHEENEVEPREWAPAISVSYKASPSHTNDQTARLQSEGDLLEPRNETPGHREEHDRDIARFAYNGEPSIQHDSVSGSGLNDARVLDDRPGQLWECLSLDELAALLLTKRVLLPIGGVPHTVHEKIDNSKCC